MKWIGQHIYDLISRFRNDVYLENISSGTIASGGNLGLDSNNKIVKQADTGITDLHGAGVDGSANQLLTDDGDGTVTSESTLIYDAETLSIGADDNGFATIQRLTHSDGNGGHLNLAGGKGTGDSKTGGDIHLYGGQSTGNQEGGALKFSTSTSDGSADANVNTIRQVFEVDSVGRVEFIGTSIGNTGSDNDLSINTDGSMQFSIDRDNDETSQSFAWTNYTTTIMELDEDGNLQIDGNLTPAGIVLDGNTITGVDDSGEFTNDDAHIMTSAAVEDKILGYGYTTNTGDITGISVSDGSTTHTTTSGDHTTQFLTGEGIDVAINNVSANVKQVTYSAEDASDSNKGVVELATTGEADTGTDTARAVTPAGLKSHVDARYTYQYISFSFSCTLVADCWHTPSQHGIDNHTWNNTHKVGGTQVASDNPPDVDGSTTISIDYLDQPSCIVIPKACKLVGFYGNSRLHGLSPDNDARPVFGLFRAAEPSDRNNSDVTATVVAFDSYDTTAAGNNMLNRFLKLNADVDVDLAAGDLIYPAFGVDKTGITGAGYGSYTMILKTLIP